MKMDNKAPGFKLPEETRKRLNEMHKKACDQMWEDYKLRAKYSGPEIDCLFLDD